VGDGVEMIIKKSALRRSLDNLTAVIIGLQAFTEVFQGKMTPDRVARPIPKSYGQMSAGGSRNQARDQYTNQLNTNKELRKEPPKPKEPCFTSQLKTETVLKRTRLAMHSHDFQLTPQERSVGSTRNIPRPNNPSRGS
jgi:hypothetical protein